MKAGTQERIRIVFIDDHTLFRESAVRLLEQQSGLFVVADCASTAEAERILKEVEADVILLDNDLGTEVGTDFLQTLRTTAPGSKVLMVTGGMAASVTLKAVEAGVAGIILKHNNPARLVEAIRRVAQGETWWDTHLIRSLGEQVRDSSAAPSNQSLTPRQSRVLRLILDGLTNKEIASELQVSETSVKSCLQELFSKAGVRTRAQLVRVAVEKHASDWLKLIDS